MSLNQLSTTYQDMKIYKGRCYKDYKINLPFCKVNKNLRHKCGH